MRGVGCVEVLVVGGEREGDEEERQEGGEVRQRNLKISFLFFDCHRTLRLHFRS